MAAISYDASVVWYWATTVASTSAPTVANIAAATRLTKVTGYVTPVSETEQDTTVINSTCETSEPGLPKYGPFAVTMKRDDTSDTMWTLFNTPHTSGYLIRSIKGVPVASSKVEVYPVKTGQRRPEGYARNAAQKFAVPFYVRAAPNLDATVAA